MAGRRQPVLRWTVGVALLAALVYWVQIQVGWAEVFAAWRRIPPTDLVAIVLLTTAGYLARAMRLVAHFGTPLDGARTRTFRVMALHNLANNLLPMRTGELSFPILLKRSFGLDPPRSIGALLWLRLLDLSAVLAAAAFALGTDRLGMVPGSGLGILAVCAPALAYSRLGRLSREGDGWRQRLARGLPRSTSSLVRGQLWTIVHWGSKLAAWSWLLARLGGIDTVPAVTGAVAGELTSVLPIHGIAGAGTYEGGVVLALGPLGVPLDAALTAATDLHIFLLAYAIVVGVAAWSLIRK
jgi:uncharacterized membrane protein YbhN (UPF0104 family)